MGQQPSYYPYNGNLPGLPPSLPAGGSPSGQLPTHWARYAKQGNNTAPAPNNSPATPQQGQGAANLEKSPESDEFVNPFMPAGPSGLALGGAGGIGIAVALEKFLGKKDTNSLLIKTAKTIDNAPIIRDISQKIEEWRHAMIQSKYFDKWTQQLFTETPSTDIEKLFVEKHINAIKNEKKLPAELKNLVGEFERRGKLSKVQDYEEFFKQYNALGKTQTQLQTIHSNLGALNVAEQVAELKELKTQGKYISQLVTELETNVPHFDQTMMGQLKGITSVKELETYVTNLAKSLEHVTTPAAQDIQALRTVNDLLTKVKSNQLPEIVLHKLETVNSADGLKTVLQDIEKLTGNGFWKNRGTKKILTGYLRRFRGFDRFYLPLYKEQEQLFKALPKRKIGAAAATVGKDTVGPIGRTFATFFNHLQRIFGGETMGLNVKHTTDNVVTRVLEKAAEAESTGLWASIKRLGGKYLPAFLGGGVVFGCALGDAYKADKGDKLSAFMYNILGFGVGQAIGIEVGRKLINGIGAFIKWRPAFFAKNLLGFMGPLRYLVPILGWASVGGALTEILAMFVLSLPFQWAGEWISKKIFGTPKKVIEEEKKKQGIHPASVPTGSKDTEKLKTFQTFLEQKKTVRESSGISNPVGHTETKRPFSITPEAIKKNSIAMTQAHMERQIEGMLGPTSDNMYINPLSIEGGH